MDDATIDPSALASTLPSDADASSLENLGDGGIRYREEALLGRGGMGEVRAAVDERIGRTIALKRATGDGKSMHARFVREARVQACLEHPAIVPVYDIGEDASAPFFTMKRLKGKTLEEVLKEELEGPHANHALLNRFVEICLAAEYAHQHGVVHRDIKPANIMLGDFGEVYLLDWGIAKLASESDSPAKDALERDDLEKTREGVVLGTLGYMAPEQLDATHEVDGRADVFSLGVVLVEILSRAELIDPAERYKLYLDGEDDIDFDVREHLAKHDTLLDELLVELLIEATHPERDKRLPSARSLADRLSAILAGDEDLIRRRQLSSNHAQDAQFHAMGTGIESHKNAILESARALALDPDNALARSTLGTILGSVPKQVPQEVIVEAERERFQESQRGILLASAAYFLTFLALPILWRMESQSWGELIPLQLALLGTVAVGVRFGRSKNPTLQMYWMAMGGNALYLALLSRVMGPISVTPAIGMMSVCIFVQHGLARNWLAIASLHIAAIIGPYLLAELGVIDPVLKLEVLDGGLLATSRIFTLSEQTVALLLGVVAGTLLLAGATSERFHRNFEGRASRSHLEQWQLRQMLPSSESGTDS